MKGIIMTTKKSVSAPVDTPVVEEEKDQTQETIAEANRIITILTTAKKYTRIRKYAVVGVSVVIGAVAMKLLASSNSSSDETTDSSEAASED
jgi:hypothetical protein